MSPKSISFEIGHTFADHTYLPFSALGAGGFCAVSGCRLAAKLVAVQQAFCDLPVTALTGAAKGPSALRIVLRSYSQTLPWIWLLPLSIDTLMTAPEARPNSAL